MVGGLWHRGEGAVVWCLVTPRGAVVGFVPFSSLPYLLKVASMGLPFSHGSDSSDSGVDDSSDDSGVDDSSGDDSGVDDCSRDES